MGQLLDFPGFLEDSNVDRDLASIEGTRQWSPRRAQPSEPTSQPPLKEESPTRGSRALLFVREGGPASNSWFGSWGVVGFTSSQREPIASEELISCLEACRP